MWTLRQFLDEEPYSRYPGISGSHYIRMLKMYLTINTNKDKQYPIIMSLLLTMTEFFNMLMI